MFVVSKFSLKILRFFLPLGVEYNLLLGIWCLSQVSLEAGDWGTLRVLSGSGVQFIVLEFCLFDAGVVCMYVLASFTY